MITLNPTLSSILSCVISHSRYHVTSHVVTWSIQAVHALWNTRSRDGHAMGFSTWFIVYHVCCVLYGYWLTVIASHAATLYIGYVSTDWLGFSISVSVQGCFECNNHLSNTTSRTWYSQQWNACLVLSVLLQSTSFALKVPLWALAKCHVSRSQGLTVPRSFCLCMSLKLERALCTWSFDSLSSPSLSCKVALLIYTTFTLPVFHVCVTVVMPHCVYQPLEINISLPQSVCHLWLDFGLI